MTEQQLKEMGLDERQAFMRDHADQVIEGEYFKAFDEAESAGMKDALATTAIELHKIDTEFQEVKDSFKERLKPLKSEYQKTLAAIRQNGEFEEGLTYAFADQDAGQMQVFDKFGNMVSSRRLKPEERQMNVLSKVV